jgi:hypothetical protein
MTSKAFSENPISVDFDPDEYIQRLKDEASAKELLVDRILVREVWILCLPCRFKAINCSNIRDGNRSHNEI